MKTVSVPMERLVTPRPCAMLADVGLNPFRQQRRSPADLVMVAGAVLVCAALVLWAFLG